MSGSTKSLVQDASSNAAPQGYDAVADLYFYLRGDSSAGEIFFRQAPISPFTIGAYAIGAVVKASAGTFFGAMGQYKGAVNAWIMIFDATSAPTLGTSPKYAAAVGPIAGPDSNWFIAPGKPLICATGIYIALSSTGGTFTASANTDLTGTVEYL